VRKLLDTPTYLSRALCKSAYLVAEDKEIIFPWISLNIHHIEKCFK